MSNLALVTLRTDWEYINFWQEKILYDFVS